MTQPLPLSPMSCPAALSLSPNVCYTKVPRVFQTFWTVWPHILSLNRKPFPALFSRKHLLTLLVCAEHPSFPLLETHSTFPHLFCAQEVDRWVCHRGFLASRELQKVTRGRKEMHFFDFPPCKDTGAGHVPHYSSWGDGSTLQYSPSPCGKSLVATNCLFSPLWFLYVCTFANKPFSKYFMGAIGGLLRPWRIYTDPAQTPGDPL